jgi:hypothetical protein
MLLLLLSLPPAGLCSPPAQLPAAFTKAVVSANIRACFVSRGEGALLAPYLLGCLFRLELREPAVLHAFEAARQRRRNQRSLLLLLLLLLCWHACCPACAIEFSSCCPSACRFINPSHLRSAEHRCHAVHALRVLLPRGWC